jgi:hypothetical protein
LRLNISNGIYFGTYLYSHEFVFEGKSFNYKVIELSIPSEGIDVSLNLISLGFTETIYFVEKWHFG